MSKDADGAAWKPPVPAIGQADLIPTVALTPDPNDDPLVHRNDGDIFDAGAAADVYLLLDDYALFPVILLIDLPRK